MNATEHSTSGTRDVPNDGTPAGDMPFTHDLVVIGAGPAGMAAAVTGARHGLNTILLDEQPRPGGQIYRDVGVVSSRVGALLGADYLQGRTLVDALAGCGAEVRHEALVWDVARDLTVTAQQDGRAFQLRGRQIVAATGAMERASPLHGWTLPGVMNAGAAQIALKSSAAVPSGDVVLAGCGPLLLLVACQLLDAGATIAAVVETAPRANRWRALAHATDALGAFGHLAKGLNLLRRLRATGVPWWHGAERVAVLGSTRAEAVQFTVDGRVHRVAADTVLLHHGVIPNTQLSRMLRVAHVWSDTQLAWQVVVDEGGQTSLPGFRIVGDGAAIAGARAAEAAGTLAALAAARALGHLDETACDTAALRPQRLRGAELRIRPFLDALYRPPEWITHPPDEVMVCRCEEVSAGRIREMARLGCQGPNQTKFFSRCGMGPCQGRMCGTVVTQLLAAELGKSPAEVGSYRIRAPLKPIPLRTLAALAAQPGDSPDKPV